MALGGGGISNRNKPSYVRMTTKSSHMIKKSIIKCQAMPQVSCILHSYVSGHATGTMDSYQSRYMQCIISPLCPAGSASSNGPYTVAGSGAANVKFAYESEKSDI